MKNECVGKLEFADTFQCGAPRSSRPTHFLLVEQYGGRPQGSPLRFCGSMWHRPLRKFAGGAEPRPYDSERNICKQGDISLFNRFLRQLCRLKNTAKANFVCPRADQTNKVSVISASDQFQNEVLELIVKKILDKAGKTDKIIRLAYCGLISLLPSSEWGPTDQKEVQKYG